MFKNTWTLTGVSPPPLRLPPNAINSGGGNHSTIEQSKEVGGKRHNPSLKNI
jgi:hypothetical protein